MTLRTPAFNDARTYGFEWLRLSNELVLQEGVINGSDFKVTAAAAGLQRVDVASGIAVVKGDSGVPGTGLSQGLYIAVNDASIANAVTLTASNGTNPRIDQIILRVLDTSDLGSASDSCVIDFVTGTATAGATLDNRSGAGALPNDALRLADVLVPAGSTAVTAGNVRDRRSWARGLQWGSTGAYGSNPATTTTGFVDTGHWSERLELTGAPMKLRLAAQVTVGTASAGVTLGVFMDGAELIRSSTYPPVAGPPNALAVDLRPFVIAGGSHVFSVSIASSVGTSTATMLNSGSTPAQFWLEESVRPLARNN